MWAVEAFHASWTSAHYNEHKIRTVRFCPKAQCMLTFETKITLNQGQIGHALKIMLVWIKVILPLDQVQTIYLECNLNTDQICQTYEQVETNYLECNLNTYQICQTYYIELYMGSN